jgi:hypothetical protein
MALPQISNVFKFKPIFPLSSPLSDGVGQSTPVKSLPIEGRGLYVIQLQTILKRRKGRCTREHANYRILKCSSTMGRIDVG